MCEYREIDTTPDNSDKGTSTEEEEEGIKCPICQESLNDGYLIRTFSCGHKAHQNCLQRVTTSCPICRKDLTEESMLCQVCLKPIPNVFIHSGRVYSYCSKCFRDYLGTEIERFKTHIINFQRHSIAFDKECYNLNIGVEAELLEFKDAYKQLKSSQESFINYILDSFLHLL